VNGTDEDEERCSTLTLRLGSGDFEAFQTAEESLFSRCSRGVVAWTLGWGLNERGLEKLTD